MSGEKSDFLDQMMAPKSNPESDAVATESEAVNDNEVQGEKQSATVETTTTEAAPPAAKPEPGHVPIAALMAEREKRQKHEEELAEAKRQLEDIQKTQQQTPMPEFFADPEGYVQAVAAQVEFRARDRMFAAMEEEQREAHEDFDTHFETAMSEAQQNPAVAKQILSARNPAKAAYDLGKRMAQSAALTADPAKYEAELEAKLRAKWEAEQAAARDAEAKAAQQAKLDAIPPDLASERSSSAKTAPKIDVFDQLFPRKT